MFLSAKARSPRRWEFQALSKPEGFWIKTVSNSLVIIGSDDPRIKPAQVKTGVCRARGTLNGVYEFIERFLGVRWFFPGKMGEVVEPMKSLQIDKVDFVDAPRFETRTMWPSYALDLEAMGVTRAEIGLWQVRNRYGGSYNFNANHSYNNWAKLYGKEHPEWFVLKKDGTRANYQEDSRHSQVCMSEPMVLQQTIAEAKAYFKDYFAGKTDNRYPGCDCFFMVMPNDVSLGCECPRCKAKYSEETKYSELVWGFVAQVADAVRQEYPQGKISCCAYSSYRAVPKTVKLPDNVVVRLCTSNISSCKDAKPGTKAAKADADMRKIAEDWNKVAPGRLYLWSYFNERDGNNLPLGGCAMTPHYIPYHFRQYLGKARGMFLEVSNWYYHEGDTYRGQKPKGKGSWMDCWMLDHLNIYMALRAFWNPEYDADQMLDDYFKKMFGKGAEPMRQFYGELETFWLDDLLERDFRNTFVLWEQVYTKDVLRRFAGYINKALSLAKGPDKDRVQWIKDWMYGEIKTRRDEYIVRKGEIDARKIYSLNVKTFGPVDGNKDKAVWKNAAAVEGFYNTKSEKSPVKTQVKTVWDSTNIYFLYICEEPQMAKLHTANAAPDLWQNDGVELFLGPQGDCREFNFYQIIVDADGKSMGLQMSKGKSSTWSSGATVAARKYKDGYAVEMRIPFAALGVDKPKDDIIWRVNCCRNRKLKAALPDANTSWARLLGNFYQPDKFGRLFFRE